MKKLSFFLFFILIFSMLAAGCSSASDQADKPSAPAAITVTTISPTSTHDPTRPELVEDAFNVDLAEGSLEIQLISGESEADFKDFEVQAFPLGNVALVRVEDPSGGYATHTELVAAGEGEEQIQGLWLSVMDSFEGDVQLLSLPDVDTSNLDFLENTSSQSFLENTVGGLAPEDWYTLFIELDENGNIPEQVDVYTLPFENSWLLQVVEKVSLLDLIFRVTPAHAANPYEMGWNYIRNEGQRMMMEEIAESRGTLFAVPELIADIDKLGVRINLDHDYYDGRYELIGLECNNRALADLEIKLSSGEESYWLTNEREFSTRFTIASSPKIGDPWYEVAWDASLGVIASRYIGGVTLKVWYCESVIDDVDLEEPAAQCTNDNCKELIIENPVGIDGSISLVGPELYQFDIPAGTTTFALESGTYNFALVMCGGDWISNGTLKPSHPWMIGMPESCDY